MVGCAFGETELMFEGVRGPGPTSGARASRLVAFDHPSELW
jgi:hypothetical protein